MKRFFRTIVVMLAMVSVLSGCNKETKEVTGIKLDKTSLSLAKGESAVLSAEITPIEASDKTIEWKSDDESIATVSQEGLVTAIDNGATTVTARAGKAVAVCIVTVSGAAVESVAINPSTLTLEKGGSAELKVEVSPEGASGYEVTWTSSNEEVATVSKDGKVTGVSLGKVTIMAFVGSKAGTCEVTVVGVPVESVTVTPETLSMKEGETAALNVEILPMEAETRTVVWTTSNESVATVDADGVVTAVGAGTAEISAKADDKTGKCTVTVIGKPQVGDYYYSDGTWSTELDKSKKVIGVVFYIDNPSLQDATLRKDHPEAVNGLVVSIDGEKPTPWQSNYKDYNNLVDTWVKQNTSYETLKVSTGESVTDRLNHIVGYNNTKAIEAFNAAPENALWKVDAVDGIAEYREKVPAPENTSGWYVASPKECSLLCSGKTDRNIWGYGCLSGSWTSDYTKMRDLLNEKLQKVEGYLPLEGANKPATYWGCAEITKEKAITTFFSFATTAGTNNKDNQYETNFRVRYILAF